MLLVTSAERDIVEKAYFAGHGFLLGKSFYQSCQTISIAESFAVGSYSAPDVKRMHVEAGCHAHKAHTHFEALMVMASNFRRGVKVHPQRFQARALARPGAAYTRSSPCRLAESSRSRRCQGCAGKPYIPGHPGFQRFGPERGFHTQDILFGVCPGSSWQDPSYKPSRH